MKTICENAHAYLKAKSNGNSPVGLTFKMEYFIQELINDNDTILYYIKRNVDLSILLLNQVVLKKDTCHVFLTLPRKL